MAKKTPKTELVKKGTAGTGITFGGKIDLSDVANIAVSKAETLYTTGISDARAALAENDKARKKLDESLEKAIEKVATDKVKTKVAQLEKGLKGLKGQVQVQVSQAKDTKYTVEISIQAERHCSVCVWDEDVVVKTAEITKQRKQLETLAKEGEELRATALDLRKKLNNIPMLERQVRAKISEQKLSEYEYGAAILEAMGSDLDSMIKLLPGS